MKTLGHYVEQEIVVLCHSEKRYIPDPLRSHFFRFPAFAFAPRLPLLSSLEQASLWRLLTRIWAMVQTVSSAAYETIYAL